MYYKISIIFLNFVIEAKGLIFAVSTIGKLTFFSVGDKESIFQKVTHNQEKEHNLIPLTRK